MPLAGLGAHSLVLAGGGNMGAALLRGWLAGGLACDAALVVEPHDAAKVVAAGLPSGQVFKSADPEWRPRVLVLAVKPQIAAEACAPLVPLVGPETLVLSIMAGVTTGRLAELAGGQGRVVRAMPNTPAAIGQGATALFAGDAVPDADRALAAALLGCVGSVHWLDAETQMDAVTAVSGSGPAYLFYLIECLAAAAESAGLPQPLALSLARETITGSAALAAASGAPASELRQQVTSPGGTTEAGLDVLMKPDGLAALMRHAVEAAARRSRELGR